MKKVLVTGATGGLGRAVCRKFDDGYVVIPCGFRNSSHEIHSVDLRDRKAWESFLSHQAPDVVVHCAAYRDPDFCEENPEEARAVNLDPLATLVEVLPDEIPLCFISSDYVFDGDHPPYSESSERNPINVYGQLKVEAEDLVFQRSLGSVLRIPLLIGSGPQWEGCGFVYQSAKLIQEGVEAHLDDESLRFPTWVNDVAAGIRWIVEHQLSGPFHLRGARGNTKLGWAREIAELLGLDSSHLSSAEGGGVTVARRPRDTHLETDKFIASGFDQTHDFRDAVISILGDHGKI